MAGSERGIPRRLHSRRALIAAGLGIGGAVLAACAPDRPVPPTKPTPEPISTIAGPLAPPATATARTVFEAKPAAPAIFTPFPTTEAKRFTDGELKTIVDEIPKLREQVFMTGYPSELEVALRNRRNNWGVEKKSFANQLPENRKDIGTRVEQTAKILFGDNATRVIAGVVAESNSLEPFFYSQTRQIIIPAGTISDSDLMRAIGKASDPIYAAEVVPFEVLAAAERGKARVLSTLFREGNQYIQSGPGSDSLKFGVGWLVLGYAHPVKFSKVEGVGTSFVNIAYEDKLGPHFEKGAPSYREFLDIAQKEGNISLNSSKDPQADFNSIRWTPERTIKVGEWFLGKLKADMEKAEENRRRFSLSQLQPSIKFGLDLQKNYNTTMDNMLDYIYAEMFRAVVESSVPLFADIERGVEEVLSAWAGKNVRLAEVRAAFKK